MTRALPGVLGAFKTRVVERPGSVALESESDGPVSYEDLWTSGVCTAAAISSIDLDPSGTIAICADRTATKHVVTALLGSLLAGRTAVLIDPLQPSERITRLLKLASSGVILDSPRMNLVHESAVPATVLSPHSSSCGHSDDPDWSISERHAAYLCFTSGSSGTPKPVLVDHRALSHTVDKLVRILCLAPGHRHLVATSWSFDVAMCDLWMTLTTGGTLVVTTTDAGGSGWADEVNGCRADIVQMLPSTAAAHRRLIPPPIVVFGGESISRDIRARFTRDSHVFVAYGVTEAGVCSTVGRALDVSYLNGVGQPLPGVVAFVVGEDMEIVARGEVGELLLGGPGLARGYLGDPRRTAERFMPDYLSGESGARLYRTGDLMRWGDDEQLQFLGRVDDQVKIRGYRVEPGEVELALLEDPAVAQAVVVASVTPAGDPCLVAYLLDDAGAVAGVRSRLADRVPSWMVPALFMQVAQFPRTPTGKVAKTELPRPDWARSDASVDDLPTTDAERALASLWSEVLGIDDIRLSDNFFDLGGHSLNAIGTVERLQLSGSEVTVPQLMAARSLREAAALLGAIDDRAVDIHREGQDDGPQIGQMSARVPLNALARQIWLLQEYAGGDVPLFNLPVTVSFDRQIDQRLLELALHATEDIHAALRTRLVLVSEGPYFEVLPPVHASLGIVADSVAVASAFHTLPFDLYQETGWRYRLERGDEVDLLSIVFHHLYFDGAGVHRILKDLASIYAGSQPASPRSTTAAATTERPADVDYWIQEFAIYPQQQATCLGVAEVRTTFAARVTDLELPDWLGSVFRATPIRRRVTTHAALLAAFSLALCEFGGLTELTIGIPVRLRDGAEVGHFANLLPLRVSLTSSDPLSALKAVSEKLANALEHRTASIETLSARLLRGDQHTGPSQLIPCVFSFDASSGALGFGSLIGLWRLRDTGYTEWPLVGEAHMDGDAMRCRLVTSAEVVSEREHDRFIDIWTRAMTQVATGLDEGLER
jgi:amino acid adenylation domain-containing protein